MFRHGNPIINEGAGRIKTDSINEKRIETVLERFDEWVTQHGGKDKFKYAVNSAQLQRSMIAFPAAGLAVLSF
jgi:hypothetical protein